jgi:hypothetical protein
VRARRCHRAERWGLTDQRGRGIPVQTTTLDRWGDGSVRWLMVDFQADTVADAPTFYALAPDQSDDDQGPSLTVTNAGEVIRVSTGVAIFDVPRAGAGFLSRAQCGDSDLLRATRIVGEDAQGSRYQLTVRRARVERAGPLRADLRLDGFLSGPSRDPWLDVSLGLSFFAGLGTIKAELSVTNPSAAKHSGGLWDLDDAASVLIRELSIDIEPAAAESADVWGSLDRSDQMQPAGVRFAVHQESSGGANWQSPNHVTRDGRIAARFRGFKASRNGREVEGLRATPIASIGGGDRRVSIALPRFWEIFPKAIEASSHRCAIAMFPRTHGDLHELHGGEGCSLSFAVCFGRDTVAAEPLSWIRSPLGVNADPVAYRRGAWAPLDTGSCRQSEGVDSLLAGANRGPNSFFERREVVDAYGWRNFGDLDADDESALVSHHDHQHDAIAGCLTRFLQTADRRWWILGDDLAAHVTGGSGVGRSAEHNHTTGLMLHHFLTGSERSRQAVIQLANRIIDMDDGSRSRLRWVDRRDGVLASVTRSKGAANSINALLDAHRLTSEPRYLEKAECLIERGVHADDEDRSSYAMFLQAVGKYLEHCADRGLIDTRYEHARGVLLKYAVSMCARGVLAPDLDAAKTPEDSTAVRPAQQLRNAAVLEFAARQNFMPVRRWLTKRVALAGAGLSAAAFMLIFFLIA